MQNVNGKVAFVTGGASGIGLGITKVLVNAGMHVVIADLRQDHLQAALNQFDVGGQREQVHGIQLDVTDREGMERAGRETLARFGKLHVLVNNAGVGCEGPLRQATFNDWDFGLSVNLGGVVNGVQLLLPLIRQHGEGGHVVNTASLAGLTYMPSFFAIYATSKAAVVTLSETMRDDLELDNIGVSVLCPGPIKSNIHESGRNRPARFQGASGFAEAEEQLARRQISELWMEPEMVGEMVLKAIQTNQLYVITHGEWREAISARMEAILAAMPTDVNPELVESLRNPKRG